MGNFDEMLEKFKDIITVIKFGGWYQYVALRIYGVVFMWLQGVFHQKCEPPEENQ